eukprot:tig00020961_g16735.t1
MCSRALSSISVCPHRVSVAPRSSPTPCASSAGGAPGLAARRGGGSRTADLETEPRRPELETCSQFTTTAPTACLASAAGMAKMTAMAPRLLASLAARCRWRRGSAAGAVAHTCSSATGQMQPKRARPLS